MKLWIAAMHPHLVIFLDIISQSDINCLSQNCGYHPQAKLIIVIARKSLIGLSANKKWATKKL